MPPGGEMADGQKNARSVLQHEFRSIRKLYGTYVGKRTIVWYIRRKKDSHNSTQHRGDEHKKYKYKKKIPLSPQVHTTDMPRDLRVHMDKLAFFSKYMISKRCHIGYPFVAVL